MLPQKWREKEHGSEEEVDDRDGGEHDEPEPEDEEDLVVDDVEGQEAHAGQSFGESGGAEILKNA